MTLSTTVKNHHVEEAIRLFKFSTMDAVAAGSADGLSRGELNEEMTRIERDIRRRLPLGWTTTYATLTKEFVSQQGYSSHALERTLYIMEKREVIRFSGQKKVVHRYGLLLPFTDRLADFILALVFDFVPIWSLTSVDGYVCRSNMY
jgi:DNA replication licensing factor MCM5